MPPDADPPVCGPSDPEDHPDKCDRQHPAEHRAGAILDRPRRVEDLHAVETSLLGKRCPERMPDTLDRNTPYVRVVDGRATVLESFHLVDFQCAAITGLVRHSDGRGGVGHLEDAERGRGSDAIVRAQERAVRRRIHDEPDTATDLGAHVGIGGPVPADEEETGREHNGRAHEPRESCVVSCLVKNGLGHWGLPGVRRPPGDPPPRRPPRHRSRALRRCRKNSRRARSIPPHVKDLWGRA